MPKILSSSPLPPLVSPSVMAKQSMSPGPPTSPPLPFSSTAVTSRSVCPSSPPCRDTITESHPIAFVTASISSESMTYALTLAFGPQPNCYLQLSQGVETFGTGIFAITASNTTVSGSSGLGPSATVPSGVVPSGTASNSTVPKGTVSSRPIPSGTLRNGTVPCEVKYPRTQRGY